MERRNRKKIIITCMIAAILLVVIGCTFYISDYYHAKETSIQLIENGTNQGSIERTNSKQIVFIPEHIEAGLIFYPGAKVQCEAYAPLMNKLAENGVLVILMKMPCNLAVLKKNAADGIQEEWPQVKNWYIGGHSLGGAMAASYLQKHVEEYDGLILLASFSTCDLSSTDLKVLSVFGKEDGVLNFESYEKYKNNLPGDYQEVEIEGGNHAQFGDYGNQKGDGLATIRPEEQWTITEESIINFMNFQ